MLESSSPAQDSSCSAPGSDGTRGSWARPLSERIGESQAGYTLETDDTIVVDDFATETRFEAPSLLRDHRVVSGITCVIHGHRGPWRVLGAHSLRPRKFGGSEAPFLHAVANVLAAAIERKRLEEQLRQSQKMEASASWPGASPTTSTTCSRPSSATATWPAAGRSTRDPDPRGHRRDPEGRRAGVRPDAAAARVFSRKQVFEPASSRPERPRRRLVRACWRALIGEHIAVRLDAPRADARPRAGRPGPGRAGDHEPRRQRPRRDARRRNAQIVTRTVSAECACDVVTAALRDRAGPRTSSSRSRTPASAWTPRPSRASSSPSSRRRSRARARASASRPSTASSSRAAANPRREPARSGTKFEIYLPRSRRSRGRRPPSRPWPTQQTVERQRDHPAGRGRRRRPRLGARRSRKQRLHGAQSQQRP